MPLHEQLALIGESDNQMHFTSETWGLLTFYPTKSDKYKDNCYHCLLRPGKDDTINECLLAPCIPEQRRDGLGGFFAIREMPIDKKNTK